MRVLKISTKANLTKKLYDFDDGESCFKMKITQAYGLAIPDDVELPDTIKEDVKNKILLLSNVDATKQTFTKGKKRKRPVYKDSLTGLNFPIKEFVRPRIVKPKEELVESIAVNVDDWTNIPDSISGDKTEAEVVKKKSKGKGRGAK